MAVANPEGGLDVGDDIADGNQPDGVVDEDQVTEEISKKKRKKKKKKTGLNQVSIGAKL